MARYRKKPVEIEAVRWTGKNGATMAVFFGGLEAHQEGLAQASAVGDKLYIYTLEGTMEAAPGDFIIRGVKGEFYPCRPDIFEATYEAVE